MSRFDTLLLTGAGSTLLLGAGFLLLRHGQPTQPPAVALAPAPAVPTVPLRLAVADGTAGPFRTVSRVVTPDVQESFDTTDAGSLPAGWSQWHNGKGSAFAVSTSKALSGAKSLACAGGSTVAARAWLDRPGATDVQASVAAYLNTLIAAQVLVRGSALDRAAPSYYAASVARGLEVQLARVVKGETKSLGTLKSAGYVSEKWVRLSLRAEGKQLRVRVQRLDTNQYLDSAGQWQPAPVWALSATDETLAGAGKVGLARPARYAGTVFLDDFTAGPPPAEEPPSVVATTPPPVKPMVKTTGPSVPPPAMATKPVAWQRPAIPRHYPHIRLAQLAYAGTPMGALEDRLLRESVDLVVPNAIYLQHIHEVAPETPQLIYTNTSNLYQDLLLDWFGYADAHGLSREAAFYHAAHAVPFRGDSPSSQPVNWFWSIYRGGQHLTKLTAAAHARNAHFAFGREGESLYVGFCERFREINVELLAPSGDGWAASLEYPAAVSDAGLPVDWKPLAAVADTTAQLTRSGQIAFDPPADWKPATLGEPGRLYHVRFRSTAGGKAPVARSILGRDFVDAHGTTSGAIPAFDAQADANGDGYLDDAEYAHRAQGKDARFLHESRLFTESYGQMRYGTRPSDAGFRAWCVERHQRMMRQHPLAGGLFMDNALGKPPVRAGDALEPLTAYSQDCGLVLRGIGEAIAPRLVLANTAGGGRHAEPLIRQIPFYFEEFAIRPLSHHWQQFEDLVTQIEWRATLTTPAPYAVIDSHPQKGEQADTRMLLGTLAYYYLFADPDSTFLMFFGGNEPNSPWSRHWVEAAAYDVGRPVEKRAVFATGADPANATLTYRVYERPYEKALVLFKPLAYARGAKQTATSADDTTTTHDLGGTYRSLQADGSLGPPVTSISLRNGEGAILLKEK